MHNAKQLAFNLMVNKVSFIPDINGFAPAQRMGDNISYDKPSNSQFKAVEQIMIVHINSFNDTPSGTRPGMRH